MAIKVFIRRYFKEGKTDRAIGLLNNIRFEALHQPGYISGETLVNHYDRQSITVVSIWQSIEDWIRWQESEVRNAKESELERLQEYPTQYEIYDFVSIRLAS